MHLAAWSGLRAAELCGLNVGDVTLRDVTTGHVRVERTVRVIDGKMAELTPKTKGSRRKVPLPPQTIAMLGDYLASHPRRDDPDAPLFPNVSLRKVRPSGLRSDDRPASAKERAQRQADALAGLSVEEAEARLDEPDWSERLRHTTFYKAVFRPAVTRANRTARASGDLAALLPPELKFHALRHTYASICADNDVPVRVVAELMGHASPHTTESVYTHLFKKDDHASTMSKLGAAQAATGRRRRGNVVPFTWSSSA